MLEHTWPACLALGLVIWFAVISLKVSHSPISKIPGPWYTPFTGAWLVLKEFTGMRRTYIHELHKRFGPVVRLSPSEVSFTSLSAIKEIYMSGGSGYDKTDFYSLFMQFSERYAYIEYQNEDEATHKHRTMFSTLGKKDHSQRKRHMAASYANSNITRPHVLEGIQNRANAFVQTCTESEGTSVDVNAYLHCYALDCASHHIFAPYGTHSIEHPTDRAIMEELCYHDSLKQNLLLYHLPRLTPFLNILCPPRPSPISNSYVQQICASRHPCPSPHTLHHALLTTKPTLPTLVIAAECIDHLSAGIDTTGSLLTFLLHHLSISTQHSIQLRLQTELLSNPRAPLNDLPYLEAIAKEALRCWPPIPMSQPRYVPEGGRSIDGYYLPEGTVVSAQAWSVHRLNEETFVDAEEFVPERWLGSDDDVSDMNRLFFAFGVGARGCTGRHLALTELKILLRTIYSKFSTRLASDMNSDMQMSDQIISSRPRGQMCKLVFEQTAGTC